mgnify:CR=1 FL=1
MRKDFYIFRHGQSTYNVAGRTQGQTNDSVLSDLGKEQAVVIGERLAGKGIEIIATSPLKRAMQTAELANKALNVPIIVDEHFIEVNVGVVEGMHYTEICEKFEDIFKKMHLPGKECENVCYPGGETRKQVRERVFDGLKNWVKQPYQTIAVSSHGIMLSQVLVALGDETTDVKNGAILHLKFEDEQWSVVEWVS